MANVLDLRRRIRSVKSTRQITKAMKMIAAAKLRRAQERAISGRPYANMLASVIGSLMRHIDLYDPQTGDVRHPLLLAREEKQALLIVVSGDKGFAGGFNGNITKAAFRFISEHSEEQIDIAAIGRKGAGSFSPPLWDGDVCREARQARTKPTTLPRTQAIEIPARPRRRRKRSAAASAKTRSKWRAITPACWISPASTRWR